MSDIELDYDYLTQRALRRVVVDVLTMTIELGATPGDHHFYIEFATTAAGVVMPDELRETYPERMTVVLQHQFEELTLDEDGFAVTLWFKGKQSRLSIPFDAVTSFADPSVQFGLRFDKAIDEPAAAKTEISDPAPKTSQPSAKTDQSNEDEGAQVVSLDQFRKK